MFALHNGDCSYQKIHFLVSTILVLVTFFSEALHAQRIVLSACHIGDFGRKTRIPGSLLSRDILDSCATNTRTKAYFVSAKTVLLVIITYFVGAICCTSLLVLALALSISDKDQLEFPP